jgi:hypothetical protein
MRIRSIDYQDGMLYVDQKYQGGLSTEVLELKNRCLLSKLLFKHLSEEGTWQQLLHNKYLKDITLALIEAKPSDSPFSERFHAR